MEIVITNEKTFQTEEQLIVNQKSISYMNTISTENIGFICELNVYEYLDKDSNLKRLKMGDAAHL